MAPTSTKVCLLCSVQITNKLFEQESLASALPELRYYASENGTISATGVVTVAIFGVTVISTAGVVTVC